MSFVCIHVYMLEFIDVCVCVWWRFCRTNVHTILAITHMTTIYLRLFGDTNWTGSNDYCKMELEISPDIFENYFFFNIGSAIRMGGSHNCIWLACAFAPTIRLVCWRRTFGVAKAKLMMIMAVMIMMMMMLADTVQNEDWVRACVRVRVGAGDSFHFYFYWHQKKPFLYYTYYY